MTLGVAVPRLPPMMALHQRFVSPALISSVLAFDPRADPRLHAGYRLDDHFLAARRHERDVDIPRHVELAERCDRASLGDDLSGARVPDAMERPPGECGGGSDAAEDEKGQGGAVHEGISREASIRLDAANLRGGFTRKLAR